MVNADRFPERRTVRKQLKLSGRNLRVSRYEHSQLTLLYFRIRNVATLNLSLHYDSMGFFTVCVQLIFLLPGLFWTQMVICWERATCQRKIESMQAWLVYFCHWRVVN